MMGRSADFYEGVAVALQEIAARATRDARDWREMAQNTVTFRAEARGAAARAKFAAWEARSATASAQLKALWARQDAARDIEAAQPVG